MRLTSFEGIENLTKKAQGRIQWIALELFSHHCIGNEMKSRKIERRTGLSGAEVRAIVQCLRNNNFPIGSNQKGYFWAFSDKELNDTYKHITERANSLTETARQLSFTMQEIRKGNKVDPTTSDKLELF